MSFRYASLHRNVSSGPQAIHIAKREDSSTRTVVRRPADHVSGGPSGVARPVHAGERAPDLGAPEEGARDVVRRLGHQRDGTRRPDRCHGAPHRRPRRPRAATAHGPAGAAGGSGQQVAGAADEEDDEHDGGQPDRDDEDGAHAEDLGRAGLARGLALHALGGAVDEAVPADGDHPDDPDDAQGRP